MSAHPNLDLIHAYNDAWIGGDLTKAAAYLAADVTFDSPINHLHSREEFIAVLTRFAPKVTGSMTIISEFADDEQVLMLYDLPISPIGLVRCCDHFVIADGKVRANKLLFDMAPFQQAARAATAARPGQ